MRNKRKNRLGWLAGLLLVTLACGFLSDDGIPSNAIFIDVAANSSAAPWLQEAADMFNDQEIETTDESPIFVQVNVMESGQTVSQLVDGEQSPVIWVPDERVWANIAAQEGVSNYQADCTNLARSPLIIAMWEPIAESLGWPGRDLGWLDIGSLAADPDAWSYYSGDLYGDSLRLGHTHPGLSASGASTLLAIVQAAQTKSEAVTVAEIQQPIVQASVGAFEGAVSWFSSGTQELGETMASRGLDFLGAAVMYESTVYQHSIADNGTRIVPVYPFEGTFMATHPACINSQATAIELEGAELFRDYLLTQEMQDLALAGYGLRPVSGLATLPADAPVGLDFQQPQTVFAPPSVETVYAVQEVWQSARKDVNMVMLLDVSGSMSGSKVDNMRRAAVQFVEQMNDDDYLTLVTFSHEIEVLADHQRVGESRDKIITAIQGVVADGDTALYDAVGFGSELIAASSSSQTSNALVVLTDGIDTFSFRYSLDDRLVNAAAANDTTVFTIAYGNDADEDLLQRLAEEAYGNYYQGSEADITRIYEAMAAAFGGNLGVGR